MPLKFDTRIMSKYTNFASTNKEREQSGTFAIKNMAPLTLDPDKKMCMKDNVHTKMV